MRYKELRNTQITAAPEQQLRFFQALQDQEHWQAQLDGFVYTLAPHYQLNTFEDVEFDPREGFDPDPEAWQASRNGWLEAKVGRTLLYCCESIVLGEGTLNLPVPGGSQFFADDYDFMGTGFYYLIAGTTEYYLTQILKNKKSKLGRRAYQQYRQQILTFSSKAELEAFKAYVTDNLGDILERIRNCTAYGSGENWMDFGLHERREAYVFRRVLTEFRNG